MIDVTNLSKRYGKHLAVDHLSFHVEKGQIYGFLGPNGAGKSTTMNMLTGYLAASEGSIQIDGHDILKEPEEAKKNIGYLPEIPPLYMDMTVKEYLQFAAELKRIPKKEIENQLDRVMYMTMIDDMSNRLIKNLSKGYKQRVGLAQAILGDPEVIILDEPTVGLDPKQIIEIRDLIKSLGKDHTVILSSHILSEVSAICDHIMIISHGKLVASDSPEGLKRMMSGNTKLILTVKSTKEKIDEVLAGFLYIDKYEVTESVEEQCVTLDLSIQEGNDIREQLFYAFAEHKMPILTMEKSEKSLEDIFLQLTDDDSEEDKDDADCEKCDNDENKENDGIIKEDSKELDKQKEVGKDESNI